MEKWPSQNVWKSLCESDNFGLTLGARGTTDGWKNYVAMTVTDAAIRKDIEFATPNAESEILDQKQLLIEKR